VGLFNLDHKAGLPFQLFLALRFLESLTQAPHYTKERLTSTEYLLPLFWKLMSRPAGLVLRSFLLLLAWHSDRQTGGFQAAATMTQGRSSASFREHAVGKSTVKGPGLKTWLTSCDKKSQETHPDSSVGQTLSPLHSHLSSGPQLLPGKGPFLHQAPTCHRTFAFLQCNPPLATLTVSNSLSVPIVY
jgi:hypothetical protein